jgi:hypothetical protein
MGKKKVIGILLTSLLVANILNPFIVNAQVPTSEPVSLTLATAQGKALQNANTIIQAKKLISNQLKRSGFTYTDGEFGVSDVENAIGTLYFKLKNREAMYTQQEAKIYLLYAIFGDTAYFSGKEDTAKFITANQFPNYSLWANIMKQSIKIQMLEADIKNATRLLYDNILSSKSQIDMSETSIGLEEKTLILLKSKYKLGEVSKVTVDVADKQLQAKKLELKKLSRTVDNLEIDLKELIGVPITTQVKLSDYATNSKVQFESYETYLNSALTNRNEIVAAKIDYWVGSNDLYDADKAFSENPLSLMAQIGKGGAQAKVTAAKLSISDSKELVLQNISDAYIDVKCKKEEMEISKANLASANKQYIIATEKFKKQLISEINKESERINYLSELAAYNTAVRTYNSALSRLQQASGLGQAY